MNIREFKKNNIITRVKPAFSDYAYIGSKLLLLGIENACIQLQPFSSKERIIRLPVDRYSEGWELYTEIYHQNTVAIERVLRKYPTAHAVQMEHNNKWVIYQYPSNDTVLAVGDTERQAWENIYEEIILKEKLLREPDDQPTSEVEIYEEAMSNAFDKALYEDKSPINTITNKKGGTSS